MVRDDEFGRWNRPISLRGAVSGSRGLNPFGDYDAPLPAHIDAPERAAMTDSSEATMSQIPAVQQAAVLDVDGNQAAADEVISSVPAFETSVARTSTSNAVPLRPQTVVIRAQNSTSSNPVPVMQPVVSGGERRGLFYEDLGSLDRYPAGMQPLIVVRDNVDRLMAGSDYALQMQLHIEHHEQCIHAFDQVGTMLHLQSALGHREVHQWLAGILHGRLVQDLNASVLPAVGTIRFMRIPTRPPLQEILTHFHGCIVNDCVWSYRSGKYGNDLTRNSLLIVVFASPADARNADYLFRRDPWFAKLKASLAPMGTSKKNPNGGPNWEFFDLCRRQRCNLLWAIASNCLLADPARRMSPAIQKELMEKGAMGLLSIGSSLNKSCNNNTSNAANVRNSRLPPPPTVPAVNASSCDAVVRAPPSTDLPNPIAVFGQRQRPVLRPASRPPADDSQAVVLRNIVVTSMKGFFEASVNAHPCRVWNSDAMVRLLKEAVLRHPPLKEFVIERLDAAGERGNELRNLLRSESTTVMYGTALVRVLPVFKRPEEYQGGYGTRSKTFKIRTLSNIYLVQEALQSASYVAISLRTNPGFEPAVRLLSLTSEDRAFLVDLAECPFGDSRVQAMLSDILTSKALLCFESQSEVLRFQSLCTAETVADFEARLYGSGFTGPYKILQKCSLSPAWQPADEALLHERYRGLELYTAKYLGALLNTAYDDYLYCASLNECVYEESVLRAIAMAMLLRRCQKEAPDSWSQTAS